MATATTNQVLNILYNQLEGKQNLLTNLKSAYGDALGEYLYNTFAAQVAAWEQANGDVTYNPYTGVIYIGANFTGISDSEPSKVDVGQLCRNARSLCHETWLTVFTTVSDAISNLDAQAKSVYTAEQLTLLANVKTAINDEWENWTGNWFTTVDATAYDAAKNSIGKLTFIPAKDVTVKANAGGAKIYPAETFDGTYTVYGGTGNDTFFYHKSVSNGKTATVKLVDWTTDDVLYLDDASIAELAQVQGQDVSLSLGNGNGSNTLVLKDMAGKPIQVFRSNGNRSYEVVYGSEGKGSYAIVGAKEESFSLPGTNTDQRLGAPNINAEGNSKAGLKITGNTQDNEIWAGSGGNYIDAGDGSDTIHGGKGKDTYYQARTGYSKDVLVDWGEDDLIQTGDCKIKSAVADSVTGGDVTLTFYHGNATNGGPTLTLKGMAGKVLHLQRGDNTNNNTIYDVIYGGDGNKGNRAVVGSGATSFTLPSQEYDDKSLGAPSIDATGNSKVGLKITGNEQDNEIWAGSGGNYIDAGDGSDTIHGGKGNDTYYQTRTGYSADVLMDWGENDLIQTGDCKIVSAVADSVTGGDVTLTFHHGNATNGGPKLTLKGMAGKVLHLQRGISVYNNPIYDVIYGGDGNKGNRAVVGSGATSFTLPSQNYDDKSLSAPNIDATGNSKAGLKITGNEENNEIWAGSGGDSIDGGDGSDTIHGGVGVDTYYQNRVGGTTDVLTDWEESDLIQIIDQYMNGAADVSADTVDGGDVTLNLRHGNGPQTLVLKGMAGKNIRLQKAEDKFYNVIYGGSGKKGSRVVVDENDTQFGLYSNIGVDNIDASTNTAGIYIQDLLGGGMNYDNAIWTGSGNDKIEAAGGNDTVYAAAGNDSILGGDGSDIIYGQAGNDYLDGGNGDDTLSGGTGNNTLFGGNGSDFFVLGSGTDTVSDFNATEDKVRYTGLLANLKSSISGSDVLLTAGASQMLLKNAGGREIGLVNAKGSTVATVTTTGDLNFTSSSIVIDKTFVGSKFDASPYGNIKTIDARNAPRAITIIGNDLDNKILLGSKGSTVKGGAGKDKISVTGGKNKLYGEDGNDSIVGGKSYDTLKGGAGNDTIRGTAGNNSIYGNTGDDRLYGGTGKDTFFYAKGDGNDKIYNFESDKDTIKYTSGALKSVSIGKDKVVTLTHASGTTVGTQKLAAMGVYGQSADIITVSGKTATTVTHNFGTYGKTNSWTVDSADIGKQGFHGSTKTDTLTVTGETKATIDLNKTSIYTSINKVSATKATADLTIKGTSAKDIIYGGKGNDCLKGGDGGDAIHGTAGNNSIYGGTGDDTLYGGTGKDTFFYAAGDGNDIIYSFGSGKDAIKDTSGALKKVSIGEDKVVTLSYGKGETAGTQKLMDMGSYGKSANIISASGKTTVTHKFGNYGEKNSWTVNSANIGKQGFHGSTKTDTLNVTGSTKATIDLNKTSLYTSINNVSASKATAAMTIKGTSGSNYLIGGKGNDVLSGGKGNDTLKGGAGDDKISVSSTGTNRLYGGTGDDTITTSASATDKIYFNAGDGKDIIINSDNKDILYLNNITDIRSEAIFGMSGQDLVMNFTVNKDTDAITITNWSTGGMNKFVVGGSTYSLQQSGNKVSVK